MNENKIIAALLTVAVNAMRPRSESKQVGHEAWRSVMEDYKNFLEALRGEDPFEKRQEPGVTT